MKRIDEKYNFYDVHKTTCETTKCISEDPMYVSHLADTNLLRLNHEKNYVCKSKPSKNELEKRKKI